MPDLGADTYLHWADRGQIIWSNNIDSPAGGMYVTDVSTGSAHQITDDSTIAFNAWIGVDTANVYGVVGLVPKGNSRFTVHAVPRAGGASFVAYETTDAYWTQGLAVDNSGLYWVDLDTNAIYHTAVAKGASAELVTYIAGGTLPGRFAIDSCNLYWLETVEGATQRLMATAK